MHTPNIVEKYVFLLIMLHYAEVFAIRRALCLHKFQTNKLKKCATFIKEIRRLRWIKV